MFRMLSQLFKSAPEEKKASSELPEAHLESTGFFKAQDIHTIGGEEGGAFCLAFIGSSREALSRYTAELRDDPQNTSGFRTGTNFRMASYCDVEIMIFFDLVGEILKIVDPHLLVLCITKERFF